VRDKHSKAEGHISRSVQGHKVNLFLSARSVVAAINSRTKWT